MLFQVVLLAIECNGNSFTKLMHLIVFHELQKMRANRQPEILSILPEKTVLLEKNGSEREGRFDFLVRAADKTIGVEVLTRPSQGKMKAKLPYANEVDEFVFAIPSDAMDFYRKKNLNGFKRMAPKRFLSREFADEKLKVWLLDCAEGRVAEKGGFGEIFEVEWQPQALKHNH
ncbi:MAG: hypothetical protein NTW59_04605 [Candidatus Diapherotrites archaeon]|nr:hypothetical protein [Candidatus Diapherotrites archaeon]